MDEPLTTLAYVHLLSKEPEKALEASKEILDSLGPQLVHYKFPALYTRMAEVIVVNILFSLFLRSLAFAIAEKYKKIALLAHGTVPE
jgi:hypothetical protein